MNFETTILTLKRHEKTEYHGRGLKLPKCGWNHLRFGPTCSSTSFQHTGKRHAFLLVDY